MTPLANPLCTLSEYQVQLALFCLLASPHPSSEPVKACVFQRLERGGAPHSSGGSFYVLVA